MRGKLTAALAVLALAAAPLAGQSNDDDYTPLNSRIRRAQPFPLSPPPNFVPPEKMGKVERDLTRSMSNQFANCLYRRSHSNSLALLEKTDFGFVNFAQIGTDGDKAMKLFGFHDCLGRVAEANNTGVAMRFYPMNLREWLIQAAYLDNYRHGPTWLKPGYTMAPRSYPLSANVPAVHAFLDFADCVVLSDPYNSDFFYRTTAGSSAEKEAISALTPALGPCLPRGVQLRLQPDELRNWIGEGLWQAANHSVPVPSGAHSAGN